MAYAVGHVSGGHFNPAVAVGLAIARRFAWREVPGYVPRRSSLPSQPPPSSGWSPAASTASAIDSGFATNGYGDRSPDGYSLVAVLVTEVVLTAFFVYIILGVTDTRAPKGFAPMAIGLALTLIHLVASR